MDGTTFNQQAIKGESAFSAVDEPLFLQETDEQGETSAQSSLSANAHESADLLRGAVLHGVLSCVVFLLVAWHLTLHCLIGPLSPQGQALSTALEPAVWTSLGIGLVLLCVMGCQYRRGIVIDAKGLIFTNTLFEGFETRVLVPWKWINRVQLEQSNSVFSRRNWLVVQTRYMIYSLKWEEVIASVEPRKLLSAIRACAPEAGLEVPLPSQAGAISGGPLTELWLQDFANHARARLGVLAPDTLLKSGRYKIVRPLGSGGQGTVYLALKQQQAESDPGSDLERRVVLKEYVFPSHSGNRSLRRCAALIEREAILLGGLDHPQVVKVLDSFAEDYRGYLVLEYVEGESLRRYVEQNGAQSEAWVSSLGSSICHILTYLHSQSPPLVHRDLTPDNLVLGSDGNVVLVDFSVARDSDQESSIAAGRQCFMPPEQFTKGAVPQSDLYSLGCTLFYLLTAEEPEPLTASRPSLLRPELHEDIDSVVVRATALELSERYASAAVMKDDLERVAQRARLSLS